MSAQADAEQQARVSAHMKLMSRFMRMIVEDPSITDEIPGGAYVFFLPEDDPDQAEIERRGAEEAAKAGKTVYLRTLPREVPAQGNGAAPNSLVS